MALQGDQVTQVLGPILAFDPRATAYAVINCDTSCAYLDTFLPTFGFFTRGANDRPRDRQMSPGIYVRAPRLVSLVARPYQGRFGGPAWTSALPNFSRGWKAEGTTLSTQLA